MEAIKDPYFTVDLLSATPNPQKVCYAAAHGDYSEKYIFDEFFGVDKTDAIAYVTPDSSVWNDPFNDRGLTEKEAGDRLVRNCVKFAHWGVLEHPQLVFSAGYFTHEVMQQARTHRIMSFDVQSGRYSGQRICQLANGELPKEELEKIFYLRPVGFYSDRKGHKYEYTDTLRNEDKEFLWEVVRRYAKRIEQGFSEEHARQVYSNYALRQHWVMSGNLRSFLHFIDVRHKADAQLEIQALADMIWEHIKVYVPEVAAWYEKNRLNKNKLAP